MPVHSRINHYRGVNAHLHSVYQSEGGWEGFHDNYIARLAEAISDLLPPGYLVDTEQSLQIREFHPATGERILRPRPDATIDAQGERAPVSTVGKAPSIVATLTQSVAETLRFEEDQFFTAAVIHKLDDGNRLGKPITRIEVLSPSNKPGGDGDLQYEEKRSAAQRSELALVEIDYLHESASPIQGIPNYPAKHPNARPYSITISNPHPSFREGVSNTYAFHVDDPIPALHVPL